ncbi:hypothetical protein DNTS_004930 [Danionella cerebrum]|uniref:ACB domain-containing protein n=1 Tax=Danionella cerebrum TaxID=2873325 RepID=A0A553MZC2_9TELE|nr:hypothetical protein DNTS_004930 [Danionella translucida]TRY58528.1 hypothetical protein DNTS_004930 [Danionella translucida]
MEADNQPVCEERFKAAVKVIQSLPSNGSFQPSHDMMLKFYSYYKQATQGPCNIPRPGFWDPVGKAKWDAWSSLGEMPKEEAMSSYVDDLKLILESMPVTSEVEELLQVIGPFYELVDERSKITQVSDLSSGFGTLLTPPSKSVTKSIIRTMEMNGNLESYAIKAAEMPKITSIEEEEEVEEVKKASQAKKRTSAGRAKALVSNGSISQHKVANGTHSSKSELNREELEVSENTRPDEDILELNGHEDVSNSQHMASDSDSEVYCDSVDQFGGDEGSQNSPELEEEDHNDFSISGEVESQQEELRREEGVQHGGEDGPGSRRTSQRHTLPVNRTDDSVVRRTRGSRSPAPGSRSAGPQQGSGGDGERWGADGPATEDLNEQIICALARLQEDMQSVLQRLHTLEALTASQKPSWWPFDVSVGTVAFAVLWPFVVQWLIRVYVQRRRRRIN